MKSSSHFRSPSFLKGIARTFNIFGHLDEYAWSDYSDSEMLRRDWESTGLDLHGEIKKHGQKRSSS